LVVGGGAGFAMTAGAWLGLRGGEAGVRGGTPAARPAALGSVRGEVVEADADGIAGPARSGTEVGVADVDGAATGADDVGVLPVARVVAAVG
jgi:hypothetical protein